jgi:hypothetical protein
VTPILAATSMNNPTHPTILFVGFVLFITFCYTAVCWTMPFTHCDRCKGVGTSPRRLSDRLRYGPAGKPRAARGWPTCPRCRGTGLRLRIGRRVYNRLSRTRRAALARRAGR